MPSSALPTPAPTITYCAHGNDKTTFCQACDLDQSPRHVIEGTVPVYVYVRDGEVEKVVVDDADVTMGLTVKKSNENFEILDEEKDPVWIQVVKDTAFDANGKKPWPAWEWGW